MLNSPECKTEQKKKNQQNTTKHIQLQVTIKKNTKKIKQKKKNFNNR